MIDSSWIVEIRTDFLTTIFKLFPFFASDYFYITITALGYWLNPSALLFRSLGFLIPFCTLLNCLLKNLFKISRPDISLHLISVYDPFGFPSGDVQVATTFWLAIFLSLKNSPFKYLCLLPIIGIGLSRVYLGVHSIYDVIGGLIFGFCVLHIWKTYLERALLVEVFQHSCKKFWFLLAIIIPLYTIVSQSLPWPPMIPMAIGALIGFGLSLRWIANQAVGLQHKISIPTALISLAILIGIAKFIPTVKINIFIFYCSIILKYSFLVFGIFVLIPSTISKITRSNKIDILDFFRN
ncbi:phosphatase PAP2 family protein [Candidatus Tisiphia endosymbiont of Piscicola geometra]|uniref:phosphatase PAP2 family protein n=1 Tax=Candidatus Tisiphia endosymbiont of Piscicola geometra TaxID=3066273 RepID=UPI00312C8578